MFPIISGYLQKAIEVLGHLENNEQNGQLNVWFRCYLNLLDALVIQKHWREWQLEHSSQQASIKFVHS